MSAWVSGAISVVKDTITLERSYLHFWIFGGSYADYQHKFGCSKHQAVHVSSLALEMKLWRRPHYRAPSYRDDVVANYSNVAVPGTGMPLSIPARFQIVALIFLVILYPILCFFAALHNALHLQDEKKDQPLPTRWARAYHIQLLESQDWFSFWRINSRLAAWHAYVISNAGEDYRDYKMENKWTFIEKGVKLGVPISPILDMKGLCVKHKNEEGGMGIHFYKNALQGGDWIIQQVITNDKFVSSLLPENAPLSTFRLMTGSLKGAGAESGAEVISAVFRAGRKGASTDHSAVLFNVDVRTGKIGRGTRNAQWYVLGPTALRSPWGPPKDELYHPDGENIKVDGAQIPNWEAIKKVVCDAHDKMITRVPLVGWDVCLTAEHGVCLLEANLSCNFFRGSFDQPKYFDFIDKYHRWCEAQEKTMKPLPAKAAKKD